MVRKLLHNFVNDCEKDYYSSVISLFLSDPTDISNNQNLRMIESNLVLAMQSDVPVHRSSEVNLLNTKQMFLE